jgi:hypothetical protein
MFVFLFHVISWILRACGWIGFGGDFALVYEMWAIWSSVKDIWLLAIFNLMILVMVISLELDRMKRLESIL